MKNSVECAHGACSCRARRSSRYCSEQCEAAAGAERASRDCPCGHAACDAGDDAGDDAEPSRSEEIS